MVGCRLTSLGMALLSHLPDSSVTSYRKCQHGVYMPSLLDPDADGPVEQDGEGEAAPSGKDPAAIALLDLAGDSKAAKVHTFLARQPIILHRKPNQNFANVFRYLLFYSLKCRVFFFQKCRTIQLYIRSKSLNRIQPMK